MSEPTPARTYRFDEFTFDARTGELRSGDRRTRLTAQLAELLVTLLERPGDLVTRDELHRRLWPAETEVDFSHGLTAAINRLRDALGDSARAPRFIETSPRRGYRWLVPVFFEPEVAAPGRMAGPLPGGAGASRANASARGRQALWFAVGLALVLAVAMAVAWKGRARGPGHRPSAEAAEAYSSGRLRLVQRADAVDLVEAEAHFRRAIDLDPAFGAAHAGLATVLAQRVYEGALPPAPGLDEARREAAEALRLAPDLAEAHLATGIVQFQADWDWAAAQSSFTRALEIAPRNIDAMRGLARLLASRGRVDEAIALRKRMVEQDPVSQSVRAGLALSYLYARRFGDAVQVLEPYVVTWSRPRMDALLAFAHAAGGQCEQALAALEPARGPRGREPDVYTVDAVRGWVYATCGRTDEARRVVVSLERDAARGAVDVALLAILHGALGDRDRAFEYLHRAVDTRSPTVIMIDVDPLFDSLRMDPRFESLAARVRAGGKRAGDRS